MAGYLNIIDKAWEASWVLRLLCAGFYFDTALIATQSTSLIQWAQGNKPELNLGWLLIALLGFCGFVALVLPLVIDFLRVLAIQLPSTKAEQSYQPIDSTLHRDILDEALEKESSFLLDYYREKHQTYQRNTRQRRDFLNLMLSLVLILSANMFAGFWLQNFNALSLFLWFYLPAFIQGVCILVFIGVISAVITNWKSWQVFYIYHPALAKKKKVR